jgi:hypothetical protein
VSGGWAKRIIALTHALVDYRGVSLFCREKTEALHEEMKWNHVRNSPTKRCHPAHSENNP